MGADKNQIRMIRLIRLIRVQKKLCGEVYAVSLMFVFPSVSS